MIGEIPRFSSDQLRSRLSVLHRAAPRSTEASILQIRPARPADLDALVRLEAAGFQHDRLSRRSLRHLLTRANASNLIAEDGDTVVGYCTVLYKRATALARLYSIAVAEAARGLGVGAALVEAAEADALEHGCIAMRLEVHVGNPAAAALYRRLGYEDLERIHDYYEDHGDAVRMERRLTDDVAPPSRVLYYEQRFDFTCGPAALMMALRALDPDQPMDEYQELRLWREATTVFMTSGTGGCGPFGLALAAHDRGFRVEVHASESDEALFADSVRSEEKKRVIRLVEEDMLAQLQQRGVPVHREALAADALSAALADEAQVLILISLYRLTGEREPHWVTVTGMDEHHIYVHEPYVDEALDRDLTDCMHMPIQHREFAGLARYGRRNLRAAVVISGGGARG